MSDRIRRLAVAVTLAAFAAVAVQAKTSPRRCPKQATRADWTMSGSVIQSVEIPNSGGAYAVTIARPIPEFPDSTEYLLLICDHEQPVTVECAGLIYGDQITAQGFVRTLEPNTGQKLTVRKLIVYAP